MNETKKMRVKTGYYPLANGDYRKAVKVVEGTAYILHITHGLGGLNVDKVEADGTDWPAEYMLVEIAQETDSCWLEGADEYLGAYPTREQAWQAADEYIASL